MILNRENFVVEYDESIKYIPEIVSYLETKMDEIMSYFELVKLSCKRKIVVYNDLDLYIKHMEQYSHYQDYMCADTNDGNINLLSLEAAHQTKEHVNMNIDDMKSIIAHEFVHICQQESEKESLENDVIWFWEALATNLGNPEQFKIIEIDEPNEKIYDLNNLKNGYPIAFTIGNYMLEKYSHEEILDYVRYPSKLFNDQEIILNKAKEWSACNKNYK